MSLGRLVMLVWFGSARTQDQSLVVEEVQQMLHVPAVMYTGNGELISSGCMSSPDGPIVVATSPTTRISSLAEMPLHLLAKYG